MRTWLLYPLSLLAMNTIHDQNPAPRITTSYVPSACANGWDLRRGSYAYACPYMAMLTDDMLNAAKRDGHHPRFYYAVAGGEADRLCGTCYQVQPLMAEKHWRDTFPMLVVQIINSGFDVMPGQMDLFVGAGGMGYFTAVNSDCQTQYCNGGPCARGMYGGDFLAWTNAQFKDPHLCYEGGVKWEDKTQDIWKICMNLSAGSAQMKDKILWDSCARSNLEHFHQNFYGTKYTRVACPKGLYTLTGLRRSDDEKYPHVHEDNHLEMSCSGNISAGHACLTTMHDGCVPSCAWPGKVDADPGYPRVDRCDESGYPI